VCVGTKASSRALYDVLKSALINQGDGSEGGGMQQRVL
jgi:hypothetical protein